MKTLKILVWWFAVIASGSGEIIFQEFRWREDCEFQRRVYMRVSGLVVTDCKERGEEKARG